MTWCSGPGLTPRADGRVYVYDYEIVQAGDAYIATLRGELTRVELHFKVKTMIRSSSLGELLTMLGTEVIRRETIREAGRLGELRMAEMKAFAALRDEGGDVPYTADG